MATVMVSTLRPPALFGAHLIKILPPSGRSDIQVRIEVFHVGDRR